MTLQSIINSLYSVYAEAKVVHWNYEAENFAAIHALSKDIYEFAEDSADIVAERMRFLKDKPELGIPETEYVRDQGLEPLINELIRCNHTIYDFMETKSKSKEVKEHPYALGEYKTTENVLLTITEQLEKFIWLLKSHIE